MYKTCTNKPTTSESGSIGAKANPCMHIVNRPMYNDSHALALQMDKSKCVRWPLTTRKFAV